MDKCPLLDLGDLTTNEDHQDSQDTYIDSMLLSIEPFNVLIVISSKISLLIKDDKLWKQ